VGVGGGKAAWGGGVTRGAGGGTGTDPAGALLATGFVAVGAVTGVAGSPVASFLGKSRDKMLIEYFLSDQARPVEVSNSAGNDGKDFLCDSLLTVAVHCQCQGNVAGIVFGLFIVEFGIMKDAAGPNEDDRGPPQITGISHRC
jgi:hypothetical protein